jgi:hypothetical protein
MTDNKATEKLAPGAKGKAGQEICRAFRNNGSCRFEKDCKYEHSSGAAIEAPPRDYTPKGDCHNWAEKKECRFAERCRFLHGASDKRTTYRVAKPENTSGEQEICRNFSQRGKCRFGSECKHKHVEGAGGKAGDSKDNGAPRRRRGGAARTGDKKEAKKATETQFDKDGVEICRNFAKGKCNRGDECQYSHGVAASTGPAPTKTRAPRASGGARSTGPKECNEFADGGECSYGDECRYKHGPSDKRDLSVKKRREPGPCYQFAEGKCEYGTECRFSHAK